MFDPRPEIRMAIRRFIPSPRQIEVTVIDDAMFARGRNHFAEQPDTLAACGEDFGSLLDAVAPYYRNHAYAALEGAQQFELFDAALLRQPLEYRQHRQPRQLDA